MPKINREEFEKAMSQVQIHIDGDEISLNGAPICLAVALVSALENLLDDSDVRETFIIRSLITQAFAEGFVDDEK